jgi:hypothetical protein
MANFAPRKWPESENAEFYTIYPRASGGLERPRTPCRRAPHKRGGRRALRTSQ